MCFYGGTFSWQQRQECYTHTAYTHLKVIAPHEAAPALHTPFSKLSTQVHLLTLSQNSHPKCIYYIKPQQRGFSEFIFLFSSQNSVLKYIYYVKPPSRGLFRICACAPYSVGTHPPPQCRSRRLCCCPCPPPPLCRSPLPCPCACPYIYMCVQYIYI